MNNEQWDPSHISSIHGDGPTQEVQSDEELKTFFHSCDSTCKKVSDGDEFSSEHVDSCRKFGVGHGLHVQFSKSSGWAVLYIQGPQVMGFASFSIHFCPSCGKKFTLD